MVKKTNDADGVSSAEPSHRAGITDQPERFRMPTA